MFKKSLLFLALLAFLAAPALASVGIRINEVPIGTATDFNFPTGTNFTTDGSIFTFTYPVTGVADFTSGTIDGTVIGGVSAAAGLFTTLSSSGAATLASAGVTGNFSVNTNKFTVAAASGNTAVAGTLGVTGASTLTGAVTTVSTVVGPGAGYGIYSISVPVTLAQLNTGYVTPYTLVPAVTGRKIRLIEAKVIDVGTTMAHTTTATGIAIYGTQTSQVALMTVPLANLTRSAVNQFGTASVTTLADGVEFEDNDAATAITIGAVGAADLITASGVQVELTYAIE